MNPTPKTEKTGSEKEHTQGPLRVGDIRAMSDRTPNDPKDMHWPIFWPDCGCAAHVFRHEDAILFAASPDLLAALEAIQKQLECPARNTCRGRAYAEGVVISTDVREQVKAAISRAKGTRE